MSFKLTQDQQWEIVLNLATLIPAMINGIPKAIEVYNKMLSAAKDGISIEEMAAAIEERDAVLKELIEKTTPTE